MNIPLNSNQQGEAVSDSAAHYKKYSQFFRLLNGGHYTNPKYAEALIRGAKTLKENGYEGVE